jgi:ribosomal protein S25
VERTSTVDIESILDAVPRYGWITSSQMADRKDLPLKNVQGKLDSLWEKGVIYRRKSCEGHGFEYRKESVFYSEEQVLRL